MLRRLRTIPSWQITLAVALLALGFLIAAQLSTEGYRIRYTTQERSSLMETALGLQSEQASLKQQILDLRAQISKLEAEGPGSDALVRQLNDDLQAARIAAGLVPLEGPGLVFRLEDSGAAGGGADALVSAQDVRVVVDELWLAGAEAVAVNGERVTVSTAFLDIGDSILANSAYLAPPYTVAAIGPQDLYDRVRSSPTFAAFVADRVQGSGIQLGVANLDAVDIQAFAGSVIVRFGRPVESGAP